MTLIYDSIIVLPNIGQTSRVFRRYLKVRWLPGLQDVRSSLSPLSAANETPAAKSHFNDALPGNTVMDNGNNKLENTSGDKQDNKGNDESVTSA